MDRKSIIVVVVCLGLLGIFYKVVDKMYPSVKAPHTATNSVVGAQSLALTNANATNAFEAVGASATTSTATLTTTSQLNISTNQPEEVIVVTNDNARYTFSSYGGGLKLIELVHYPETVATRRGEKKWETNHVAMLNAQSTAPTLAILNGIEQGDGVYQLTSPTPTRVHAEKTLANGLTLVKDFSLSTNYLVTASVRFENHSTQAMTLPAQEWVVGTAAPMSAQDKGDAVGLMWNNGTKSQDISAASYFSARGFACMPRTPPAEYRSGQSNVVWAATHNQFFTMILVPKDAAQEVVGRSINLPPPSADELLENPRANLTPKGLLTTLTYPTTMLAPTQSLQRDFVLFAGPKEYQTLAKISTSLNTDLDSVMGFGFFGIFAKGLLLAMNWLHHTLSLPYGWTIIFITVLIKLIFWPLTAASTRSMKRMQALQPQMKAIADKYKDDPLKKNQKTMEFMKENKVNPMGGCLPMLFQMPIFIGFFTMIRSAIELRGAPFLWIADLSKPDTLFMIPGINFPFNLLPLLMGATMLWQSHMTPPSPGMDPAQQKMMRYMPLIFLVFLYNYSAGMALYWTTNNLLSILQTKLTKTNPTPTPAPVLTSPPKKKK
jgi:YidC/Oxa1 family membrane protein insertase